MENGAPLEYLNEEQDQWENGQDILLSPSEQSSLDSEQSAEQSTDQSAQDTFSPVYEMGAFQSYTLADMGNLMGAGVCVGFAVAVCIALASWAVACAISIIKKGGN